MKKFLKNAACLTAVFMASTPVTLAAGPAETWTYGASVYGWFPDISGTTRVPVMGGDDFTIGIGEILDNLQFTLQGTLDARKGNWGMFTDVIYMDLGKTRSEIRDGTVGGTVLPWSVDGNLEFDLKSWIWTTAGYYRLVDGPDTSFDLHAGVRYIEIDQALRWSLSGDIGAMQAPGREGSATVAGDYWDVIVGFRGRFGFGQSGNWFVPLYADIGTGDSDFTWQAVTGLGYAFDWGQVVTVWRYLDYTLPSGKPLEDMNFSGPAVGIVFRW